ncbi:unnamed protein product [Sphagnum jensenii]|uniref:C-terminal of Roc (COR) domain-containing protein n=1 Tax=Sphagnum jensenii TaxID=128206 RepID=A0ABP0WZL9_9BRYO
MAYASDTDVVQEVSKILASSDVVVESFKNFQREWKELCVEMRYHRCKADSNDDRLEEPEVEGDVPHRWSLSRVDGLKELVPAIVKSTNLKALSFAWGLDYPDIVDPLLQGLYTNNTIVTARFYVSFRNAAIPDFMDKFAVMLCHNTSLKHFSLDISESYLPLSRYVNASGVDRSLELLQLQARDLLQLSVRETVEELVQPLIMDENGNQVNSTLTTLTFSGFFVMSSFSARIAGMLRRNSSIKHLTLERSLATESDARELIQSLADNHSLETLDLRRCWGVKGTVFHAIMDVLLINFTLKKIGLRWTPLSRNGKDVVINKQLQKNAAAKELHLMELEMAEPTSARVIFCGSPYAGKTTLCKAVIRSLEQKSGINKNIINPSKDFMLKKIDGVQRSIQGTAQLTQRTRGIQVHGLNNIQGNRWSIWDIGGQEEFHGFHYFMFPDLSDTSNPSLFLLVCSPYALRDEGFPSKTKLKQPTEIRKELEYWLRFIASKSRSTISFKPKVIVVLTHFDKDDGFVARAQDTFTSLKNQFVEWVDVISKPIAVDAFSTQSASTLASFIQANITDVLERLPPIYKVCPEVQSALEHWMTKNPKTPMMNWKTFSDLCQKSDLLGLVRVSIEERMVEERRKAVATSMHNSGDIIYFEDLDFLVVNLDWFCHRVMGHLIKISDNRVKLSSAIDSDGFTSRAYLEKVLNDSLKSSHDLGYHKMSLYITPHNLVELMLRLELCFESTTGSNDDHKLFIPTILDIDQGQKSWKWSQHSSSNSSIYFGRRLQCDDQKCTFIPRGFFCQLQVLLYNKFSRLDNGTRAVYTPKDGFIDIVFNGVEFVLEYNANVGTHIDVLVHSQSKTLDEALDMFHEHIMKHIQERCAAPNGCQGVTLVEGVIRTECVKQQISFKQRQDQAILLEDLKQAIFTHGSGYQHSWDELLEGGNLILPVACEFAIELMGKKEIEDLLERGLKEGRIHEVHNACWNEATMVTREWAGPSSSTRLELKAKKHIVKVNTPHDAWTKRNIWQEDLHEQDPSPQHHTEIALSELTHEVRNLSTFVQVTHKQQQDMYKQQQDTHKLLTDVLSVTKLIRNLILNSTQKQVPRIVLFTTHDTNLKQKLITKLVPGMKALQLHLLCEYKTKEHMVEGQPGCEVILEDQNWKKIHEFVVEGLKWVSVAVKVGAHIAMGLEHMVPTPNLEYGKAVVAVGEGVLKDPPIDWATVTPEKPVREEAFAIRTAKTMAFAEQWLVDFLKDKNISTKFGLQRVVYKDAQGRKTGEMGWICKKHFNEGMRVGELEGYAC